MLNPDMMPEAEVSLRLAFYLLRQGLTASDISVGIDGAQVQVKDKEIFPILDFLADEGWVRILSGTGAWRGTFRHEEYEQQLEIHSRPGVGDVACSLRDGRNFWAECKKGTLERSKSSSEYPLLRGAIGHLVTIESATATDLLAVAVPSSDKFESLAESWRQAPLIAKVAISILTVCRDGRVDGWPAE